MKKKPKFNFNLCSRFGRQAIIKTFFLSIVSPLVFTVFLCFNMTEAGAQCRSHAQCDDANPCTVDKCQGRVCNYTSVVTLDIDFESTECFGNSVRIRNKSKGVDANAVYHLDIGNNGTIDFSLPASQVQRDSFVVFPVAGTFDFKLTVVNPDGCSDELVSQITILDCDDGDPCTVDFCGPGRGAATNNNNGFGFGRKLECRNIAFICNDGDPCSTDACGPNNQCIFTPIDCDDNDPCTTDYCDNGACVNESVVILDFDFNSPVCLGDTVTVTNNSTGVDPAAIYYFDLFSDGTIELIVPASALPADSSEIAPFGGNFPFTVIVINPDGCSDTLVSQLDILDCDDGDPCTTDDCNDGVCSYTRDRKRVG